MSSPILHIKDSYFFEIPKFLWRSHRDADWDGQHDFPDFWIALDDDYLTWEAARFLDQLPAAGVELPADVDWRGEYQHWLHADHAHAGRPFRDFLAETPWYREQQQAIVEGDGSSGQLEWEQTMDAAQQAARDVASYKQEGPTWSEAKVAGYNHALDGKILIPQPFGTLRNLYEPDSGFLISKFMIVEVVVAVLVAVLCIRVAGWMQRSDRPRGRLWNFVESILLFFRDQVARPAIGEHDADKFVPLLWTIFLFVLGLNLMGMVPWVGAPTGAFAVTLGMAAFTLLTGIVMGSIKFGPVGYWLNQVPSMDLPWYIAIIIKPMIWLIEVGGMLIKHSVLGVRLLANMFAGHVVLLGLMGIAFSLQGAASHFWWLAAPISVISATLFSLLELFVAFLQAYIFTFLSALFIGAAVHHH